MLQKVLNEVKRAGGTVNLNELALKLNVERSALDGMIQFWIRKGRIRDDDLAESQPFEACQTNGCAGNCPGPKGCPFVMTPPRTFSIKLVD
jgi:hypothetical protein